MLGALGRAGWASGWRGPTRQVLAPAGVRQHVVTTLWVSSPHPFPAGSGCSRGRSTPPALPAPRLGGHWGLRCGCRGRARRLAEPRRPGAAPGLALGGGGRPAGTAAPPRIARKGEVLLPGSEESYAGAEWGWEIGSRPGAAPRRGRGRGRSGSHPKAVSPESRRTSMQEMRSSECRR